MGTIKAHLGRRYEQLKIAAYWVRRNQVLLGIRTRPLAPGVVAGFRRDCVRQRAY
jgi:hypothetical protein